MISAISITTRKISITTGAIFIAIGKGSNSPGWRKGGEFYTRRFFV
jgi:hypothetical protein